MCDKSSSWPSGYNGFISVILRDDNPFFTKRRDRDDWYDGWAAASKD